MFVIAIIAYNNDDHKTANVRCIVFVQYSVVEPIHFHVDDTCSSEITSRTVIDFVFLRAN